MDPAIRRKIILVLLLFAVYTGVSFWVPYSKLWVMKDLMQSQSRMFYTYPNTERVRDFLIGKAEDLELPLKPEDVKVQSINGEIIYIEMNWDAPVDILMYHTSLHFSPRIFGLIRGFGAGAQGELSNDEMQSQLSDSTARFLRQKNLLQHSIRDFFSR